MKKKKIKEKEIVIGGSRVFLQPIELKDVDNVMTWVNDPEVVKNFQNFGEFTRKQELAFLRKMKRSQNDFLFSVFDWDDGKYIGQAAINQVSWQNRLGRLALFVKKEFWNQGYAKEILSMLVGFAFEELGLHKVWLMVYASNKKARHIYRKLGFRQEGILKDEYFWRGEYHDIVRMAIVNRKPAKQ